MKRSSQRILTTHIGSLPRPRDLWDLLEAKDRGLPYDRTRLDDVIRTAVVDVVRQQTAVGIDIPSDGEFSKPSFVTYVRNRLSGMDGVNTEGYAGPPPKHPQYDEWFRTRGPNLGALMGKLPLNVSPIAWRGDAELNADINNLSTALKGLNFEEPFMPSVAVGQVLFAIPSAYYSSDREYLYAIADAMKSEYKAIIDAGFVLQLDSPDFVMMRNRQYWNKSWEEYRASLELRIEALNHALEGLPEDRIRFHVCWGNLEGPHDYDVPLRDVVDLLLKVEAGAYSIEGANPRHAHEWRIWEEVKFPDGKILIAGVIDTVTSFIEHPELVALRIVQLARVIGRENVIAAPDCGFATFGAWEPRVHPEIMWAKFRAMVEGVRIATKQLWGKASSA